MTTRAFQAGINLTFKSRQDTVQSRASFPVRPNGEVQLVQLNQEWELSDGSCAVTHVRLSCSEFPLGSCLITPGGDIDLFVAAKRWPEALEHRFDVGAQRPGRPWESPSAAEAHAIWRWGDQHPFSLYIPADPNLKEPVEVNGTIYVVLEGVESKASHMGGRFILT